MADVEYRLQRFLQCSRKAYWEWDYENKEFWHSANLQKFFCLEDNERINSLEAFLVLIHPEDVEEIQSAMNSLKCGSSLRFEHRVRLKMLGSYGSFLLGMNICPTGQFLCGVISSTNLEDSSDQSQGREKILDSILDNTSAVIFAKDLQGRYLLANERCCNLCGLKGDILGKDDFEIFPKGAAEKFQSADKMVLEKDHVVELIEEAPHEDGMHTYISTKVPLRDNSGAVYGIAGIATDITLEQKAKEELALAADLKSQFMANMSHEIRTPMNGILISAELLEKSSLDRDQLELVGTIRESAEAMLSVINGVLDFSKLESGKLELYPEKFAIADLVARLKKVHSLLSLKKGLKLDISLDSNFANHYYADQGRLTQVLHNLLGNAIKFTPEGGEVSLQIKRISSGEEVDVIEMIVDDTGIGIPSDKSEKIFEAFTQADPSITRLFGGTGLGLTISSRLIKSMEGTIQLVEKSGQGARFSVELPLRTWSPEIDSRDTEQEPTCQVEFERKLKILVVEDNKVNQLVAIRALSEFGHTIDCANNGVEALNFFRNNRYDIILMDIQMPEMDGIEATKRIQKQNDEETPVIALTAHAMPGDREELLKEGFNDYLSKPLRRKQLLMKVIQWSTQ